MSGLIYYILDTETTGFSPKIHEICQVSLIRAHDRHQLDRDVICEFPERASLEALKINGKSKRDLLRGSCKEDVVEALNNFMFKDEATAEHRVIIAHNAHFDRGFMHALYTKVGKVFPAINWLDTKKLAAMFAKKQGIEKPELTLLASMNLLEVKPFIGKNHTAQHDARNAYLLWKKAMDLEIDYLPHIKRKPHLSSASHEDVGDSYEE